VSIDAATLSILWPAFIAGLLVTATHVPLGMQVLQRGIVFIDLAIAQIAGVGVILADYLGWAPTGAAVQIAALSAALACAMILTWTEHRWPEVQEAIIGVVFILASSVAILILAKNPRGSENLKELLVGQILWVNPRSLPLEALFYGAIMALWFGMGQRLGRIGFYVLFGCAVTISVQLVGLFLVFTTLVVPALATFLRQAASLLEGLFNRGARLCCGSIGLGRGRPSLGRHDRVRDNDCRSDVCAGNRPPHPKQPATLKLATVDQSLDCCQQPLDRVIEQPKQILCLLGPTHSERQHYGRNVGPLREGLGSPWAVVGPINDHPGRIALHSLHQLRKMRRGGRYAGFRFEAARIAHPHPVHEIRKVLVVYDDGDSLESRAFLFPTFDRGLPAAAKGLGALLVRIRIGVIDLYQPSSENLGDLGDISRIEMNVRVA